MRKRIRRKEKGKARQGKARRGKAERLDDAAARSMGRATAAGKDPIRCDAMQCLRRRGDGGGHALGVEVELSVGAGQGRTCAQQDRQVPPYVLCVELREVQTNRQGGLGCPWAEASRPCRIRQPG